MVQLGDIAEVFNGMTPSRSDQRAVGHPVLKIRDVSADGRFKGEFDSFVEPRFARGFASKWVQPGDTLILNAAHSALFVASKVYLATEEVAGALPTGEWLVVRTKAADAACLHYWLRSNAAASRLSAIVKGIHLYPRDVAELKVPLPSLAEQKRMSAILHKADAVRCKRQEPSRSPNNSSARRSSRCSATLHRAGR
jgi:type I restriction enzyme S subunit